MVKKTYLKFPHTQRYIIEELVLVNTHKSVITEYNGVQDSYVYGEL